LDLLEDFEPLAGLEGLLGHPVAELVEHGANLEIAQHVLQLSVGGFGLFEPPLADFQKALEAVEPTLFLIGPVVEDGVLGQIRRRNPVGPLHLGDDLPEGLVLTAVELPPQGDGVPPLLAEEAPCMARAP